MIANYIIILFIIICIGIAIGLNNKSKEQQETDNNTNDIPHMDTDFIHNETEDIDNLELKELRKINNHLIDIEIKTAQQNEILKDIQFCINFIAFCIFIPLIVKVICAILGINALSDLIGSL